MAPKGKTSPDTSQPAFHAYAGTRPCIYRHAQQNHRTKRSREPKTTPHTTLTAPTHLPASPATTQLLGGSGVFYCLTLLAPINTEGTAIALPVG